MKTTNDRKASLPAPAPKAAANHKRFRIEKLEERIAPSKGGKGTHNCGGDSSITITLSCSSY
jgi:hypothetical protein